MVNIIMGNELRHWMRLVEATDDDPALPPKAKAREFRATPDLLDIAVADTEASEHRHVMAADAHGVVVGALRQLDRQVKYGVHTLDDVAKDWSKTHEFIRTKYGDRVILYRADAPAKDHNPGTLTLYFASKKMADRYNGAGRVAKPYFVNTADIVAVHARPNGYYEVIVRRSKEGITPMDPAKLRY